jgi:AcrR family transcriptional regulator
MVTETDLVELDAKERIIEAAAYLFSLKGYDATSTREIAARANVNAASLNYYFKGKHNLLDEVIVSVVQNFKAKIWNIKSDDDLTAAGFAVKVFEAITAEGPKCLNQFKLILDATHYPDDKMDPFPMCFEQISHYLNKELNPSVSMDDRLWASHVIFNYINHTAIMSVSKIGQIHQNKFLQHTSLQNYITTLVETIIRDLNHRFP